MRTQTEIKTLARQLKAATATIQDDDDLTNEDIVKQAILHALEWTLQEEQKVDYSLN